MKRPLISLVLSLLLQSFSAPAQGVSTGWVDLRQYSQNHGLQYRYDPLSKIAALDGPETQLRFHLDSDYMLDRGRLLRLAAKTYIARDTVLAAWPAPLTDTSKPPVVLKAPAVHQIRKVVVDAGHGGSDAGAISPLGLHEKRVALDVARRVKELLEARGLEVIMTRNSDVFIPLSQRAAISNKTGADLFISIHANAATTRSLDGFEIYTLSEATDDAALAVERAENSVIRFESFRAQAPDKNLKTILWDLKESQNRRGSLRVAKHVMDHVTAAVATAAQRLRSANFYVLKWTECPAVLVELGYLSNQADERRLRSPLYKANLARQIVEGVWSYKKEYEMTNGFSA